MYDVIIIGAGAAGVFCAHALRGAKVLIIDAGMEAKTEHCLDNSFAHLRRSQDLFDDIIGRDFESMHGIEGEEITPRLRSPLMRFVVDSPPSTPAIVSNGFRAITSYAAGGLANAWGAQIYRFDDKDLRAFPITAADLEPFYDALARHIGISGADDDLTPFHGPTPGLLPPLRLSSTGRDLLDRYERRRMYFSRRGIYIGRPRLAVLSVDHDDRTACKYDNLEFFRPGESSTYTPLFTLRAMVQRGEIEYRPRLLAERYWEGGDSVRVAARSIDTGEPHVEEARKLVLCLGALNTGRLVLASAEDHAARLPVVTNPCSFVPLVCPARIGMPYDERTFSAQLSLILRGPEDDPAVVGMLYGNEGLLRSDMLFDFPMSIRGCAAAAKYVLPATALLQLFYPAGPQDGNTLALSPAGDGVVSFTNAMPEKTYERSLLGVFARIGYLGLPRLVKRLPAGLSIHYAGTLPMRPRPEHKYQVGPECRLGGSQRVYVGDAASFPHLPAKNLTFTIMANAMRVGTSIREELERER